MAITDLKENCVINKETGCWDWQGAKTGAGYSAKKINGKTLLVHRLMFLEVKGEIPIDKELDHICHNRACINPDHLRAVTRAENCQNRLNTKLTLDKVLEIKKLYKTKTQKEIGDIFHIRQDTVSRIINELRWKPIVNNKNI